MPFLDSDDIADIIAAVRGTPDDAPGAPCPCVPEQLFLRCDLCARSMRSETCFICKRCRRKHHPSHPVVASAIDRGMNQVDAMQDAFTEAHTTGVWH